ncbi:DNA-directed RNA polymerase subunit beta [Vagococcus hydrophili]|uniref:DNA-directed RNA polymerase subunit beta n=1 Tax=Vagococcus hydrophili TaxID=2714947 RepID=A0A6G8AQD1_9ENTE|nr:DNA-directed RNA polymerase subunit beta [Vagococcus hydrophili]QIL47197.1 DNA-directed RNA polymerase subunit beta [Vagococcus hydrophili]
MGTITKRVIIQVSLVILTILIFVALFFAGIFIGYVVLGKGYKSDAFNPATWNHILDFFK